MLLLILLILLLLLLLLLMLMLCGWCCRSRYKVDRHHLAAKKYMFQGWFDSPVFFWRNYNMSTSTRWTYRQTLDSLPNFAWKTIWNECYHIGPPRSWTLSRDLPCIFSDTIPKMFLHWILHWFANQMQIKLTTVVVRFHVCFQRWKILFFGFGTSFS